MQKRGRGVFFTAGLALFALALLAAAQAPAPKPSRLPEQEKRLPSLDVPRIAPTELPEQCQRARERAEQLRAELESGLSPQAKAAAEQYAAKPGPGVSREKAWGDYAAASLMGDAPVAAWAGLKAADVRWNGETATNAGIYLYHLGKVPEALQLLNCAYEMGYRSPYLFEALAVIHQTQGNNAQARQAIGQAQQAAPDDTIIETEASFINTGQPPPPRPPQRDPDGLDEAVRELAEHGERALNLIKIQADELDRSLPPDSGARQYQQIFADYINSMVQIARDLARKARAEADPTMRRATINSALSTCIYGYAQISDTLLSFPARTVTNGSPLLLWADALGLDAPVLARESYRTGIGVWEMHGGLGLARGALDDYRRDKDAAYREYTQRLHACNGASCDIRETARWCGVWKQLYEVWENASRQRHNTAARNFDRLATRRVIEAENEYLQVRDYAVRQFRKMRFRKLPGYDEEQVLLQTVNLQILNVYGHVNPSEDIHGGKVVFSTVLYLRDQALWFEGERSGMENLLAGEAEQMQNQCEPAMRALLELLAQEEWQAYLDHLRDRLAWDIQGKTESEFPCEGSVGPLSTSIDVNKLGSGEGKFDLKWKPKLYEGGSGKVSGSVGVSVGVGGQASEIPSIGGGGSYGPFAGKGKVTLTSKVNPYNSQEYMGIKLKGSAGFGLKAGKLGAACYPSSGSVTFYPRALLNDAAKYMSTPSTRPSGGRP